jgi:hypothetical protein
VDAAFAAMAEYLARTDGWTVPLRARMPEREAWQWWFVTDQGGPLAVVSHPGHERRQG